jgi:AAA domain
MLTRPPDPDRPWASHPFYRGMPDEAAAPSWAAREKRRLEDEEWDRANDPPNDGWQPPGDYPDARDVRLDDLAASSTQPHIEPISLPPLTVNEWRERDLPEPDFLMGNWLTTTSRVLLTAATGLGKSNLGIALGMRVAAGGEFLHWKGRRKARVLYIDGEMSRRLLKQRVLDEAERLGSSPSTFLALSHEDIPNFRPFNTPEGQAWVSALIKKLGGVDLVIFDNIMSLTVGDMKDPAPWQQTIPLALALTRDLVGQIWIHHAGHDETRSYGDKTREWQMDTVVHLDAVKRNETDVSFSMSFKKARERTPTTRFDFQDVKIALVNDRWEHELTDARRPGKVPPQTRKALDALTNIIGSDKAVALSENRRAAMVEHWKAECALLGLIDLNVPNSARTLFAKFRRELVAANRIACEGDLSWLIR